MINCHKNLTYTYTQFLFKLVRELLITDQRLSQMSKTFNSFRIFVHTNKRKYLVCMFH